MRGGDERRGEEKRRGGVRLGEVGIILGGKLP